METASELQRWGAFAFGAVIGWNLYLINRYRRGDVSLADLVTLIGAIGGGAILTLFKPDTDLFGAYGLGLAAGFFAYFLVMLLMVLVSKYFTIEWFLDGRRKKLADDQVIDPATGSTVHPMEEGNRPAGGPR